MGPLIVGIAWATPELGSLAYKIAMRNPPLFPEFEIPPGGGRKFQFPELLFRGPPKKANDLIFWALSFVSIGANPKLYGNQKGEPPPGQATPEPHWVGSDRTPAAGSSKKSLAGDVFLFGLNKGIRLLFIIIDHE